MGNEKSMDRFHDAKSMLTLKGTFDHTLVIIIVHSEPCVSKGPFKYFHMWSMDEELSVLVT